MVRLFRKFVNFCKKRVVSAAFFIFLSFWSVASLASILEKFSPNFLAGHASSRPSEIANSFRAPAGDLPFSEIVSFRAGKALFELDLARALNKFDDARRVGASRCSDCHAGGARGSVVQSGKYNLPAHPLVAFQGVAPLPIASTDVPDILALREAVLEWIPVDVSIEGRNFSLVKPAIFIGREMLEEVHVRMTPPQIGLGLIEEIDDSDILSWFSLNGRGRVSWVREHANDGSPTVGRFGMKAQHRSVVSIVSTALETELGLDANVLGERRIEMLALYSGELGVPVRRENRHYEGEKHFSSFGCQSCHRPQYKIMRAINGKSVPLEIWPFSDFLLHNLGYGDGDPSYDGWWRTTPLWGLGRVVAVSDTPGYLHDGRARDLREAILWHGGEAQAERRRFLAASPVEQRELIEFLESL